MIKYLLSLCLFIVSYALVADDIFYNDPFYGNPAFKYKGEFYPTLDASFFTFKRPLNEKVFGSLVGSSSDLQSFSVRKVKLADLGLNIKEGDVAYFVNLYKKTIRKYVFRDYVNIIIYSDLYDKMYWGRYNILLTDDESEYDEVKSSLTNNNCNGFVYIGNDLDFSKARFAKAKLQEVSEKDKLPKRFSAKKKEETLNKTRVSYEFKEQMFLINYSPFFIDQKNGKISEPVSEVFNGSVSRDMTTLDYIKFENNLSMIPLYQHYQLGMRVLVINGDKYEYIDVKYNKKWEPEPEEKKK